MREHRSQLDLGRLCRIAGVSRSGYYEYLSREESLRSRENRRLSVRIGAIYHEHRQVYGALRIWRELAAQGHACGKHRVARLMKAAGLRSVHRRRYRPQTTNSKHGWAIADNLIRQDFSAKAPNQKWGCDISYIPTGEGWLYLAIVMDFYSRKIVGYALGDSLQASLCGEALKQACLRRNPPAELIHHSDRGVQYASSEYRKILEEHRLIPSMSRKGNCYDNAMVESFFHTLKVELIHRKTYASRQEAANDIQNYIQGFYNSIRRHSSIDYLSPNLYEKLKPLAA